jgi:hypothetical protein
MLHPRSVELRFFFRSQIPKEIAAVYNSGLGRSGLLNKHPFKGLLRSLRPLPPGGVYFFLTAEENFLWISGFVSA